MPSEYLFEEIEEEKAGLFSKKALAEKGHVSQGDIASLLALFGNAKTFGSLIQVPPKLAAKLPEIEQRLNDVLTHGDLTHATAHVVTSLLKQASFLARQYDAVVANPPYMGSKFYSPTLKVFVNREYSDAKADLYACFMQRNATAAKPNCFVGMITIPNWMFLASFEDVRKALFNHQTIDTFIHNGRGVFGSDFGSCSFVLRTRNLPEFRGVFRKLFDKQGSVASNDELEDRYFRASPFFAAGSDFLVIPGSPVAYWVNSRLRDSFVLGTPLNEIGKATLGMNSTDNAKFVRLWQEVAIETIGFTFGSNAEATASEFRWFPYNKGGAYRKWYGNREYVINWYKGGKDIHEFNGLPIDYRGAPVRSKQYQFNEAITWSFVSSSFFGVRYSPKGSLFDVAGSSFFAESTRLPLLTGFLCSPLAFAMLQILNPTLNFQVGNVGSLPLVPEVWKHEDKLTQIAHECIAIAKADWDQSEVSWDFRRLPLCPELVAPGIGTIEETFHTYSRSAVGSVERMRHLEEENNRILCDAFALLQEVLRDVPVESITLYRPSQEEDIKRLFSYAVGCMMGRYSLDKPGLIYARSGNQDFDPGQYKTFRADDDGIIPLLETDWGIRDDAANRIVEFIGVAWPKEHLEENLKFIVDSLGQNDGEQSRETIRRYLVTGFYKQHLSMYKKRPIYWLFSSGKQRAFQCLVYLHRYHEGTLARMRTEYVIPLQGQIAARIEQLEGDKAKASSTSHRKKVQKEQDDLKKQHAELLTFEEKLKHAADQKISLDLDDGVKVNYGKFGDLLAESKAITGGKDET